VVWKLIILFAEYPFQNLFEFETKITLHVISAIRYHVGVMSLYLVFDTASTFNPGKGYDMIRAISCFALSLSIFLKKWKDL
jgi:hypothetical protein